MKKTTYFILGILLTLSIVLIPWAFEIADKTRLYNSTGGEVFMIALPLMLVWKIISIAEQNEKMYKKKIKKLQE